MPRSAEVTMNPNSFGLLVTCLPKRAVPSLQYHASKYKLNHGPSCHPQSRCKPARPLWRSVEHRAFVSRLVRLPRWLLPASPLSNIARWRITTDSARRDSGVAALVRLAEQVCFARHGNNVRAPVPPRFTVFYASIAAIRIKDRRW